MKNRTLLSLVAAVLLAGISAVSAAPMENGKMASQASDQPNLTPKQQTTAWDDLYTDVLNQKTPSGFKAIVGAASPTITSAPVTTKAANDVPALKPYKFAMMEHKLAIINPSDGKIAESSPDSTSGARGWAWPSKATVAPMVPATRVPAAWRVANVVWAGGNIAGLNG